MLRGKKGKKSVNTHLLVRGNKKASCKREQGEKEISINNNLQSQDGVENASFTEWKIAFGKKPSPRGLSEAKGRNVKHEKGETRLPKL